MVTQNYLQPHETFISYSNQDLLSIETFEKYSLKRGIEIIYTKPSNKTLEPIKPVTRKQSIMKAILDTIEDLNLDKNKLPSYKNGTSSIKSEISARLIETSKKNSSFTITEKSFDHAWSQLIRDGVITKPVSH